MIKHSFAVLLLILLVLQLRGDEGGIENLAVSTTESSSSSISACAAENQRLHQRLERLERIFNMSQFNPDFEDVSLLEILVMQTRSKLFAAVPRTDPECQFNWIIGKCFPLCNCTFAPKLGDFSPSRACRLIPPETRNETCDPNSLQIPWFLRVSAALTSAWHSAHKTTVMIKTAITENAPPSDSHCKWSWKLRDMGCRPKNDCALVYEWGDYSLDRMCRLRVDDYDRDDDDDDDDENDTGSAGSDAESDAENVSGSRDENGLSSVPESAAGVDEGKNPPPTNAASAPAEPIETPSAPFDQRARTSHREADNTPPVDEKRKVPITLNF